MQERDQDEAVAIFLRYPGSAADNTEYKIIFGWAWGCQGSTAAEEWHRGLVCQPVSVRYHEHGTEKLANTKEDLVKADTEPQHSKITDIFDNVPFRIESIPPEP